MARQNVSEAMVNHKLLRATSVFVIRKIMRFKK